MDASAYALVHGLHRTRSALQIWRLERWRVLRAWLLGSLLAAVGLLAAVWLIGSLSLGPGPVALHRPPFVTGTPRDAVSILLRNGLVLSFHAMACVAGFIAGSSMPLRASAQRHRVLRLVHERGGRVAIVFVAGATILSLSIQAMVLGVGLGRVAFALHTSPGLLLLGLLPHALPELTALFLPLAAWILASRAGRWDELLAATVVTAGVAVPVLVLSALSEVYLAPHVLGSLVR